MSTLEKRIEDAFSESIRIKQKSFELLLPSILLAAEHIKNCLMQGSKILSCGNGGSACDAQHFAAEMLNRFEIERPSLPAIALTCDSATMTAIGNDYHFDHVFEKQIQALGNQGDILLAITTSGQSKNILQAVLAAHDRGMSVIALTGREGGALAKCLQKKDIELRVPGERTARIQETHILLIHCLCDLVDSTLFQTHN